MVVEQPGILAAIIDITIHGTSAEQKRRFKKLRTIKTLDELTQEFQKALLAAVTFRLFQFA